MKNNNSHNSIIQEIVVNMHIENINSKKGYNYLSSGIIKFFNNNSIELSILYPKQVYNKFVGIIDIKRSSVLEFIGDCNKRKLVINFDDYDKTRLLGSMSGINPNNELEVNFMDILIKK